MKDHTTAEIFEELWKRIEYDANVSEELASESNELQARIDKAVETINKMICDGCTITNKGTSRNYMATGYNSEFGVRATELLDILKGGGENEKSNNT